MVVALRRVVGSHQHLFLSFRRPVSSAHVFQEVRRNRRRSVIGPLSMWENGRIQFLRITGPWWEEDSHSAVTHALTTSSLYRPWHPMTDGSASETMRCHVL